MIEKQEKHEEHIGGKHHEVAKKEYGFKISKLMLWKIISTVLGILLIVSIFTSGFGIGSDTATGGEAQAAQEEAKKWLNQKVVLVKRQEVQ